MAASSTPSRTAGGTSRSSESSSSPQPPKPPKPPTNVPSSSTSNTIYRRRTPRSIPPWIATYDQRHGPVPDSQRRLLRPPEPSARPRHNAPPREPQWRTSVDGFVNHDDPELGPRKTPRSRFRHFLKYGRAPRRGRDWDHLRSSSPVIVSGYSSAPRSASMEWSGFLQSSAWGRPQGETSEVVAPEVLDQLQPTFNQKGSAASDPAAARPLRRRRTMKISSAIWRRMMRSSLAPILFRLFVMITSIMALGISARLFQLEDAAGRDTAERTQSVVAVAVDSVAIPFLAFTIWDELTGKPLGLRSAVNKISIILLDLIFIIFKSASTALAFEFVVYHSLGVSNALALTKALASIMLLGLLAWSLNFALNIFRTVVKLGGGHNADHHADVAYMV